jgi:hypothetical protein
MKVVAKKKLPSMFHSILQAGSPLAWQMKWRRQYQVGLYLPKRENLLLQPLLNLQRQKRSVVIHQFSKCILMFKIF